MTDFAHLSVEIMMALFVSIGGPIVLHIGFKEKPKKAAPKLATTRKMSAKKPKKMKGKKWAVAPKLSDTQLMWDRLYVHGRDYGSAPQKSNMPL